MHKVQECTNILTPTPSHHTHNMPASSASFAPVFRSKQRKTGAKEGGIRSAKSMLSWTDTGAQVMIVICKIHAQFNGTEGPGYYYLSVCAYACLCPQIFRFFNMQTQSGPARSKHEEMGLHDLSVTWEGRSRLRRKSGSMQTLRVMTRMRRSSPSLISVCCSESLILHADGFWIVVFKKIYYSPHSNEPSPKKLLRGGHGSSSRYASTVCPNFFQKNPTH
jgi:hypothetical protein